MQMAVNKRVCRALILPSFFRNKESDRCGLNKELALKRFRSFEGMKIFSSLKMGLECTIKFGILNRKLRIKIFKQKFLWVTDFEYHIKFIRS